MNCKNLVPVTITYIEYEKGDFLGYVLSYISLSILFVVSSFITLIVLRRDLHTILAFIGIILNEFINMILKRILVEPRPTCHSSVTLGNEFGMPSSHSQAAWCVSGYLLCFILTRLTFVNYSSTTWKPVLLTLCFIWSTLVSYSRIYLQYHTTSQVVWGGVIGFTIGIMWFGIVYSIFAPRFRQISTWRISKALCIEDTTDPTNYNVNGDETVTYRNHNESRNSKKMS